MNVTITLQHSSTARKYFLFSLHMKNTITLALAICGFATAQANTNVRVSNITYDIKPASVCDTTPQDVVFKKVEIESEFPGGQKGWTAYLNGNLAYPKKAVRKNIQGTVVVQFIVERDGRVSNVEVVKSVDPLLDNEALRLIQQSPNWKPAVQDGKKVRSYKKQPIVFQLVEDTPKKKG